MMRVMGLGWLEREGTILRFAVLMLFKARTSSTSSFASIYFQYHPVLSLKSLNQNEKGEMCDLFLIRSGKTVKGHHSKAEF